MNQSSQRQSIQDEVPLILPEVDPNKTVLDLVVSKDKDIDARDLFTQAKLSRYYQNTDARLDLKEWAKKVVTWSLVVVGLILFMTGFNCLTLSAPVLITLLGTTTLNILGLAFIVLKGHFPQDDHEI